MLYKMLERNAKLFGSRRAVLYDTFEADYDRLFKDVVKKALHLQRFEGKRIAIYGPASYRWIVNMLGTILAGKDAVLVDFFLPHEVREHNLKDVDTDYILCSTNQYILSDESAIMITDAEKDDVTGLVYDENTAEGNVLVFTANDKKCEKAVILNIEGVVSLLGELSSRIGISCEDRLLSQVPLDTAFGLVYSLLLPLYAGACVCVGRGLRHINADTYYYNPTYLPGSPSMIEYLKNIKGFNEELKTVIIGGAPCPKELFESLKERGFSVCSIYGQAETSGCVGIATDVYNRYRILDGVNVSLDKDGFIRIGGKCVMSGYFGDAVKIGVYDSGDRGCLDDGVLTVESYNSSLIYFPTGEVICKKAVIKELHEMHGVVECCVFMHEGKLTAVLSVMPDEMNRDRFQRRIDKYNKKKGYRWAIQRLELTDKRLARNSDGSVDVDAVQAMLG